MSTESALPSIERLKELMGADPNSAEIHRLLGLNPNAAQPAAWKAWRKPSPSLPIDDRVAALLDRTRAPMLSAARRAGRSYCPFYQARQFIFSAVLHACAEERAWKSMPAGAEHLARIAKQSDRARKQVERLLADLSNYECFDPEPWRPARHMPQSAAYQEGLAARDAVQSIGSQLVDSLITLQGRARATQGAIRGDVSKVDPWRAAFAFVIGQLWFELIDAPPATHNDSFFVEFVTAAYDSICSTPSSWNRAKDPALHRHAKSSPEHGFGRFALLAKAEPSEDYLARLAAKLQKSREDEEAAISAPPRGDRH